MGCWAIRTNAIDDPFETNSIYRQRDIIEKGFNQLKNEVDGSRLGATESAYRGKLFIYTLAQSLRMNMLVTAREAQRANKGLKVPEESLSKLIGQLGSIQARKHRSTDTFVTGAVAKKRRDLLALLRIEKLPKYFDRF